MNKHLLTACLLMAFGSLSHGQITTNLKIDGSTLGLTNPNPAGSAALENLGTEAYLNYSIDTAGLLSLNHDFANSGPTIVKDWGDALDFSSVAGLSVGAGTAFTFGITVKGRLPAGGTAELKSGDTADVTGLGLGVQGGNQFRLDWRFSDASSESLLFQVTATDIPSTLRLVITSFEFGNANVSGGAQPQGKIDSLANVAGFAGGNLEIIPAGVGPNSITIPDGGISIVGGGGGETVASFVLSQANKPTSGEAGFSLQGITFDVVPVAVPEPATVAIYAGLAVMGLAVWRRRRRA